MGGKIIPRIRLISAKDFVEFEAELDKISFELLKKKNILVEKILNKKVLWTDATLKIVAQINVTIKCLTCAKWS